METRPHPQGPGAPDHEKMGLHRGVPLTFISQFLSGRPRNKGPNEAQLDSEIDCSP